MIVRAMLWIVAASALIAGIASAAPMATVLTASAPHQELPLATVAAKPATVTLTIAAIDNPSSQAFSLAASVAWTSNDGHRTVEPLRRVTPYPPNRPGSFVIALDAPVRSLFGRGDGQLALVLALQPIATDRPLIEPLRVSISPPVWR